MTVRKWTIPLTLAGLGGLGAVLFTQRGRSFLRSAMRRVGADPGCLAAWNDSARDELNHIRQAVRELEQSLGTHSAR
jgi:hypothetical protein